MSEAIVDINGLVFDVEFDYQPKEAETLYYPGCNESIDITGVKVQSVEVGEFISTYWIGRIKEELMEMH
jgi:hypothetical protein